MADDIDLTQERYAKMLEAHIIVRKPEGPKPNGKCHTCDEPLPEPLRWCDANCRDEYERSFLSTINRR